MAAKLPNLSSAPWLADPAIRKIFSTLNRDGDSARIVGGAVRNALLGLSVRDIDFATTAPPEVVETRATAAGMKVVRTGFEHGTVTLVTNKTGYEVTTLREDIETDGRRAVVRFGDNWETDARRRDFTINALSVDAEGTVHDPVDGHDDVIARRVRFIGDPAARIAEDRLRILRFFRFHAEYGRDELDPAGLSASIQAREGLRDLSAERVGQEMRKLIVGARAAETLGAMQDSGILGIVLGGIGYLGPFGRLVALEAGLGIPADPALRFAAAGCRIEEDALRLAERLRLTNDERDRAVAAVGAGRAFARRPPPREARRLLYRLGPDAYRDAAIIAFSWSADPVDDPYWRDAIRLPSAWQAPRFPIGGRDIMGAGGARGRAVGDLLRALESWWLDQDFQPDEAALRSRLQQMIAAQQ